MKSLVVLIMMVVTATVAFADDSFDNQRYFFTSGQYIKLIEQYPGFFYTEKAKEEIKNLVVLYGDEEMVHFLAEDYLRYWRGIYKQGIPAEASIFDSDTSRLQREYLAVERAHRLISEIMKKH